MQVKHLMRQMRIDCCLLKDKRELAIVDRYARSARFVTLILTTICYFGIVFFGIFQLLPLILDYVSPLNESRPRRLFVITEYFVSQEKYFYAMVLHEALIICVGINALIGVLMMIVGYMLHSCALLKITSYRIENVLGSLSGSEKKDFLYKRMINMIVIHQRATEFVNVLSSVFGRSFTMLVFVGVTSTIINLLQLLQVVTSNNFGEASVVALVTFTHFVYMFVINFYGQQMINHGADLFRAFYNGMWYAAPLRTQKLLLFVMQKGILDVHLDVGGMFIASLECFAALVSSTISYFTVIYSVR
ncbi:uncharacterized protein LOC109858673 [Pseudomyrmex gracilis]|uniref:uncharacterized protein LOC109858673 n=1 Tax=Pseudomyrmex gracilis TaxID=219809 RepID=UPI0009950CFE|nr:uncharacterized protein LOC109858673 [Pseudomyrmex gracilis]